MRKLIMLLVLIAAPVLAGDYIVLWLDLRASTADKVTVRDALKNQLNDRTTIPFADLPTWELIANPNIAGMVCAISRDQVKRLTNDVSRLTPNILNTWATNNLAQPQYLRWRSGDDPLAVLRDAGLRVRQSGSAQ
jgi:hypothetical protein